MAGEIFPSESGHDQSESVPGKRPSMPPELISALMSDGKDKDVLRYLGLAEEVEVTMSTDKTEDTTVQQTETKDLRIIFDIHCATADYGETCLHLLVLTGKDELALKVFQKEKSLLKAVNKSSETPLHIAARTGRTKIVCKLIELDTNLVKEALAITDNKGNTTLHAAARNGYKEIGSALMKLDPELATKRNSQGLSPLYVAIDSRCTEMVQTMLKDNPNLAFAKLNLDGMLPVHVAARVGDKNLVKHIMEKYPSHAELLDSRDRNLFHIAAEANQSELFELTHYGKVGSMVQNMNTATDFEGNTPLHIAAKLGHRLTMSVIHRNLLHPDAQLIRNREDYTPLELSAKEVEKSASADEIKDIKGRIDQYISINGYKFTSRWFEDIMAPSDKSKWERTQVIGLGAVLITTVTFAAAFTIPGGYDQNDGTPIMGRKIAYKAFTVANTLSFALAFTSLYTLVSIALVDPDYAHLKDATNAFTASAGFMVLAFALGSYVMLVPVSFPIAIIVLVLSLPLGSPFMPLAVTFYRSVLNWMLQFMKRFMPPLRELMLQSMTVLRVLMLYLIKMAFTFSIALINCSCILLVLVFIGLGIFIGILKATSR